MAWGCGGLVTSYLANDVHLWSCSARPIRAGTRLADRIQVDTRRARFGLVTSYLANDIHLWSRSAPPVRAASRSTDHIRQGSRQAGHNPVRKRGARSIKPYRAATVRSRLHSQPLSQRT